MFFLSCAMACRGHRKAAERGWKLDHTLENGNCVPVVCPLSQSLQKRLLPTPFSVQVKPLASGAIFIWLHPESPQSFCPLYIHTPTCMCSHDSHLSCFTIAVKEHLTQTAYSRKSLSRAHHSRGLEYLTSMVGSPAAGWQVGAGAQAESLNPYSRV